MNGHTVLHADSKVFYTYSWYLLVLFCWTYVYMMYGYLFLLKSTDVIDNTCGFSQQVSFSAYFWHWFQCLSVNGVSPFVSAPLGLWVAPSAWMVRSFRDWSLEKKNRGKTSETKPGGCVFISFFFIWGFPKMALIFRGVTSPHLHHFCEFCHATSKDIRRTCPPFGVPEPRNPHFPSGAWAQEEPSRVYH